MTDIQAQGLALGGGAIAAALIDALHAKGLLDLAECRDVLTKAVEGFGAPREDRGKSGCLSR